MKVLSPRDHGPVKSIRECPLKTDWEFLFEVTQGDDIRYHVPPGARFGYGMESLSFREASNHVSEVVRRNIERDPHVVKVLGEARPGPDTHIDRVTLKLTRYTFAMTSLLPTAIELAVKAHGNQLNMDKTLYILHPLRVMMQAKGEDEQIVAILHDAIEDTDLTLAQVEAAGLAASEFGFPKKIINALNLLTRREGQDYQNYLENIAESRLATKVKLLDLHDNIDLTRLPVAEQRDSDRALKYHRAIRFLVANLFGGH